MYFTKHNIDNGFQIDYSLKGGQRSRKKTESALDRAAYSNNRSYLPIKIDKKTHTHTQAHLASNNAEAIPSVKLITYRKEKPFVSLNCFQCTIKNSRDFFKSRFVCEWAIEMCVPFSVHYSSQLNESSSLSFFSFALFLVVSIHKMNKNRIPTKRKKSHGKWIIVAISEFFNLIVNKKKQKTNN